MIFFSKHSAYAVPVGEHCSEIQEAAVLKQKTWNKGFILPFIPWEVSLTRLSLLFSVCYLKSHILEMLCVRPNWPQVQVQYNSSSHKSSLTHQVCFKLWHSISTQSPSRQCSISRYLPVQLMAPRVRLGCSGLQTECPCHQVLSCHGTGSAAERSSGPWKCYGHCCLPHCDPPYSGEVGRQVVALPQLGDLAQGKPMAVARSGCASHHGQQGP